MKQQMDTKEADKPVQIQGLRARKAAPVAEQVAGRRQPRLCPQASRAVC